MLARSVNSLRRAVMLQRPSGIACLATAAGPEPPTRPTPAYARFAKAKYQATMAALPEGSTSKDAFRDIGRQWQAASDAELDVYFDEFQKESDQYKSAVESFLAAGGDPASLKRKSPKGKRVKRDPTKPKRAMTTWTAFVKHYMNSVKKPEVKVTEAMKAASVAFKALPAAELAAFERQADEDAARYSQEMAQWTTAQEADERA